MPLVFACIAPHSGHLLLGKHEPSPIPRTRAAMAELHCLLNLSGAETLAVVTPHGIYLEGAITMGVTARMAGAQDGVEVDLQTDLDLAAAWAYRAVNVGVPVLPVVVDDLNKPLPLDWGATIPLALLDPPPSSRRAVVACPARSIGRPELVAFGETLVEAADELGTRVALVVSADQGHGHSAIGPYGFTPNSAEFDFKMADAVASDDLTRLLDWDESWIESALPDSYWQTLMLIGVQARTGLKAHVLSYEVDHYFGLMCASFTR